MSEKRKREQSRASKESETKEPQISLLSERAKKYDPDATVEDLIADLRNVQERFPDIFISRNKYRKEGEYSDSTWDCRFGTFKEFRRQAGLELHRGATKIEIDTALHAARDRYRGFFEIEVAPYVGKYEKTDNSKGLKTILIGSDFHDRESDPFVLSVFIDTARRVQPDVICLAGDIFDLYEFSRFDKDPRQTDIRGRFDFVREEIFRPLREACPRAQIDFLMGNHDYRLIRHMADRTPYLRCLMDLMGISLSQVFGLDKFQINLVTRADLSAHTPAEFKAEIRKNYKVYYKCFVVDHYGDNGFQLCGASGHTHKPRLTTNVNELIGNSFWITLGCICNIDLEYVEGLNKYQNGFAMVHIDPETKECIPEPIICTANRALVGGKFYSRL
jgi:predicted phosphodiesterase